MIYLVHLVIGWFLWLVVLRTLACEALTLFPGAANYDIFKFSSRILLHTNTVHMEPFLHRNLRSPKFMATAQTDDWSVPVAAPAPIINFYCNNAPCKAGIPSMSPFLLIQLQYDFPTWSSQSKRYFNVCIVTIHALVLDVTMLGLDSRLEI